MLLGSPLIGLTIYACSIRWSSRHYAIPPFVPTTGFGLFGTYAGSATTRSIQTLSPTPTSTSSSSSFSKSCKSRRNKEISQQIFGNCLEPVLFLLKRRRYDPEFLAPTSRLAQELINFLRKVDRETAGNCLVVSNQCHVQRSTSYREKPTMSDIEALLGM